MNVSRQELERVKAQLEELLQWVNSKLAQDSNTSQTAPQPQQSPTAQPSTQPHPEPRPNSTTPATPTHDSHLHDEKPVSGIAGHERTGCIIAAIAFAALTIGIIFILPNCIYQ